MKRQQKERRLLQVVVACGILLALIALLALFSKKYRRDTFVTTQPATTDTLLNGQSITSKTPLVSKNGVYSVGIFGTKFSIRKNNNPCLDYDILANYVFDPIVLNTNNNLSLYSTPYKSIVWQSRTTNKGVGKAHLIMQDDGKLVIYDEKKTALWYVQYRQSSNMLGDSQEFTYKQKCLVSNNGKYILSISKSGDLAIKDSKNNMIKSIFKNPLQISNATSSSIQSTDPNIAAYNRLPKYFLKINADNDMTIEHRTSIDSSETLWRTNTSSKGIGDAYAVIEDDGSFVLYDSQKNKLWSS